MRTCAARTQPLVFGQFSRYERATGTRGLSLKLLAGVGLNVCEVPGHEEKIKIRDQREVTRQLQRLQAHRNSFATAHLLNPGLSPGKPHVQRSPDSEGG